MKINILLPALGNSGGMDVIYKYADILNKKGHDVIIYKEIVAANMHRYPSKIKNKLHQFYCTIKCLITVWKDKKHYDRIVFKANNMSVRNGNILMATAWTTAFKVYKMNDEKGKKFYFVQGYEIWDNEMLGKKSYLLPLNKIVISSWINNELKTALGIGPFPIVYNGIDTQIYNSINRKISKTTPKKFLMLNHTLKTKGVKEGITAFEKIQAEYPDCELIMFGMNSSADLPTYITYYQNPKRNKLVELYCSSDIFIFSSLREGWGMTPIEAMACGCVVVASATGCVLDIGRHKENMMISEPGDIDGMVENIELLLKNDDLYEKIQRKGKETIGELNWDKSAERLLETFENE